ncbi:homing endonuclease associated repeat-containing protein [Salinigranum halophilum]|uniref:homing endonuclease associated repeat-containing protein n=1 Tax=Salinigranum halophilum TaxID=2565931 RepID=UPI00115C847D|nr:hypothetical protein [Salinigranum halophilum]
MRNYEEDELISDLKRVCEELGRPVTMAEYRRNGQAAPETYIRRFGSWREAHELVGNDISNRGGVKR